MKGSLVVFAKDTKLSKVKTRLANETDKKFAQKFYQLSLNAIFELLREVKKQSLNQLQINLDLYCALPEKQTIKKKKWQKHGVLPIWTTSYDLAISLNYINQLLINRYDFVIMIGSDSPQIICNDIMVVVEEFKQSKQKKCIIGPSFDGGFYLFASNEEIKPKIWLGIKYSKPTTCNQLIKHLKNNHQIIKQLKDQIDIDTLTNIDSLKKELNKITLNQSQRKLFDWLNQQNLA